MAELPLRLGERIKVFGLTNALHHNEKEGTIMTTVHVETLRCGVLLDSGETINLKLENMHRILYQVSNLFQQKNINYNNISIKTLILLICLNLSQLNCNSIHKSFKREYLNIYGTAYLKNLKVTFLMLVKNLH